MQWTEVLVVRFLFESAAKGVAVRELCRILNAKKIPSPAITKGILNRRMKDMSGWQPMAISRMLTNSGYYGEYRQFRTVSLGRVPGLKTAGRRYTTEAEQVVLAIPAIVTRELAKAAQKRVARNKQLATRNNQTSRDSLLRGGLARCGYCDSALRVYRKIDTRANGKEVAYFSYNCSRPYNSIGQCPGCSIAADTLDNAAWGKAVEIISDPSEVDKKVAHLTSGSKAIEQRKKTLKSLADIRNEQETLRSNLTKLLKKETLDEQTAGFLSGQLRLLEQQEQNALKDLAEEQRWQEKFNTLQQEVVRFHEHCTQWREQLDNAAFVPSCDFKREACIFFGISVTAWKLGHEPRFEINTSPPDIVELLS